MICEIASFPATGTPDNNRRRMCPVEIKPGIRVIQGPDWQSERQDDGLGHAGTIIYVPKEGSSDKKVTVIWDNGQVMRCRAGGDSKYDLRVLDNAPVGVKHTTITCNICNEHPLIGIRWKCGTCTDFDLCTKCYMGGKHAHSHGFMRMEVEHVVATPVSPRLFAKKVTIRGVFNGATVMRGPHWKWKNDDGCGTEEGTVVGVETWQKDADRGGVRVKWNATKKEGLYRMGGDGYVDVIYTKESYFGQYYIDHLPLVDIVSLGEVILKNSDKVVVSLDLNHFKRLQEHDTYGKWADGMKQCINETGTVIKMLYGGRAARVQYENSNIWTVKRQALYRTHSFSVKEVVTIVEDANTVRELQKGHGGWKDEMTSTLGKVGRIARIDNDGDVSVKVGPRVWMYSPVCLKPLEDLSLASQAPDLTTAELEHGDIDDIKRMIDMERVAGVLADMFVGLLRGVLDTDESELSVVEAAAKGDLDRVRAVVEKDPSKVNATHESRTALQIASYEGNINVVSYLLERKADVNIKDNDGDTALHYAAFGTEEDSMTLLINEGAQTNVQNKKGRTSLHITVGNGSVPCTKLLIKAGASVNLMDDDGDSPLHDCIIQKCDQDQLINAVFNADRPDFLQCNKKGFNVLHLAALKNCKRAVEIILKRNKAVVDTKLSIGYMCTALHICAAVDHLEIASQLLEEKANTNVRDNDGRTPLIVAVTQNNKRTIELLITHECDVNVQDNKGNTALHVAQIRRAHPDELARLLGVPISNDDTGIQISCMLVVARANIDLKNKNGETPLDVCNDATREFLRGLSLSSSKLTLATSQSGVILPTHWENMAESLCRIPLDTSNGLHEKEFKEVKNGFYRTLPQAMILTIERVQNTFLWELYVFKRKQMEKIYGRGCANELELYHCTDPKNVEVICEKNLDFRLAGDNIGALFGQGTYFARDAKYSDSYTTPDSNQHKFILQCRVLAGKWTYGHPKYRRPPPVDSSNPRTLYDCCVDNVNKPNIFCLFDQNQYYPEYVIKYI